MCVCACVRACVRACVHACVRACVRVCVCPAIFLLLVVTMSWSRSMPALLITSSGAKIEFLKYVDEFVRDPYSFIIFLNDSRWMRSKAILNSMKLIIRDVWCSRLCSIIVIKVKICSLQDRPFRKPACFSPSLLSTCSLSLFSRTEQNTFPEVESSVMPLQLLQSLRFSFFTSVTMAPRRQSPVHLLPAI